MNKNPGILGRKVGMTQLFTEDGSLVPCTVIDASCVVVGKRTEAKDGYSAVVLGLGERRDKRTTKAMKTACEKAGPADGHGIYQRQDRDPNASHTAVSVPQHLRELRLPAETVAGYTIGQELNLDELFEVGQRVDVQSRSKGRGFTGVMRRHNFAGAKASHGAHETKRHGGSIGTTTTPGRVWPGTKMAGQHGNKIVSVLNQKVAKVIADKKLLLIAGNVPGARNSIVRVQGAVKKRIKNL